MRWSQRSFETQVATVFAGLAVVLAATLSLGLGWLVAEQSRADAVVELRGVAGNAARMLADGLVFRSRELETLAKSRTSWSDGLASERVEQMLERVRTITPHSAWIGVVSTDGTVRSAIDGLLVGQSVAQRQWFQMGLRTTHLGDVHPAKLLAALLPPTRDGAPPRFVDFASPITASDGRVIGVLGMHGSWEWVRSVVEALLPENAGARGLDVFVLDRQGRALYASRGGDLTRWDRTSLEADPTTGERYLLAAVAVRAEALPEDLGWSVVAREPVSTAYAAARRGLPRGLAFVLGAASAASALGWWLATRVTRPLRHVATAARDVEAGVAGARIPVVAANPEFRQLSMALAGMTARLQHANLELEARVRERTAELEQVNHELEQQSRSDPLTGLLNRRGFEDRFKQTLSHARRRRAPLSVLTIDVDRFEHINAVHGRDAGERTLKALAGALKRRLRECDVTARLGGQRFAVLLPETDRHQAGHLAVALVKRVRDEPIGPSDGITISCGLAEVRLDDDSARSALARADETLYRGRSETSGRPDAADRSAGSEGSDTVRGSAGSDTARGSAGANASDRRERAAAAETNAEPV